MDKKQLIIPAVTLVMCMLVLVGVGYALDTSVDNSGNNVAIEGYEISLDDGSEVTTNKVFDAGVVKYTKVTKTGATQSVEYNIAADQNITLSDSVTLKSVKTGPNAGPLAGELTVKVVDSDKGLQKYFGDKLYINIDGKGAVELTTSDGVTYTAASTITFDGEGAVVLTGTTVAQTGLTQAPTFVGTFTVSFSLAAN